MIAATEASSGASGGEWARISVVGGRDQGVVGVEVEVARKQERAGRREVIACWVIYLVILADRPRGQSTGVGADPCLLPLPVGPTTGTGGN